MEIQKFAVEFVTSSMTNHDTPSIRLIQFEGETETNAAFGGGVCWSVKDIIEFQPSMIGTVERYVRDLFDAAPVDTFLIAMNDEQSSRIELSDPHVKTRLDLVLPMLRAMHRVWRADMKAAAMTAEAA